jgi:hypothetical protein
MMAAARAANTKSDRDARGEVVEDAAHDVEGGDRDDQRRQAEVGHQRAVDDPDRGTDAEGHQQGNSPGDTAVIHRVVADEERDQAGGRAHREVDVPHDDEVGLPHGEEADER